MKILISLSYYTPYISGVTIYAKNLAEGLVRDKYQITVLTSSHEKKLPLKDTINGVTVIRVPIAFQIGKGPVMFSFLKSLIEEVKKTDVVNCHLPQFESGLIAIVAKLFHKKIILTYHTDLAIERSVQGIVIRYCLYAAQIVAGILADSIVTQSADYANQSAYLRFFKRKVTVIYPPIIFSPSSEKTKQLFLEKLSKKRKVLIGVLGRMAKEKGYEYLLESIPFLREKLGDDFLIIFAGPKNPIGEEKYVQKISALFQKYENFVTHKGVLDDKEMGAYYSLLDVFVLPSINTTEAFGMVQIEAMISGTPVVASDLPGVRTIIQQTGMGEIAKKKNAKDLADKLIQVITYRNSYTKQQKKVQKMFSFEKTLKEYRELFEQ